MSHAALTVSGLLLLSVCSMAPAGAGETAQFSRSRSAAEEYQSRVRLVRGMPGFVALWDFVLRESGSQRFLAHQRKRATPGFALDAVNYVRDYWGEGRTAAYS
ncbi:MAG TPA: hypothetical protein VN428_00445, partial [Bryobacteraceae bacterium]|nr:hypothetical protein [Bryobacteraceae bacterium]